MIKYNINFTTNNGIKYSLFVNGKTTIQKLLSRYESIVDIYNSQYFYNGQKILFGLDFYNSICVADYFKIEKNPTIFVVINEQNQISKIFNVTFKLNDGEKVILMFNSSSTVDIIKKIFK